MKPLSIRLRLTLWFFFILAGSLLVFAVLTLTVLRHAVDRSVDRQLYAHMTAVRQIVGEDANRSRKALSADLDEDVELAPDLTLLQIWGANGAVVYRSPAMGLMQVPQMAPPPLERPATRAYRSHPLRVLVRAMPGSGGRYTVMVAIPVHDFATAIREVEGTLWIVIPLLLLVSLVGGYWISGRAFAPVRAMIGAAEAIHPGDLSARLAVPEAEDELQRLALTLNRMLARLQSGFERITRFTADASHELRTPIALLRTRTEVLLRRPRTAEEYRSALEANLEELETTSVLLEQMMLLARADAGAETLHFSTLDLAELVRATAAVTKPMAEAKGLAWSVAVMAAEAPVRGDEAALRRLLLVLIDNAVKYTPEGGRVEIALLACDGSAVVEVRDSGIGIGREDLGHVFDRFYRADSVRASDGAGLGLSIGSWIAERHGGTLSGESDVAAGSTFRIILPLTATRAAPLAV